MLIVNWIRHHNCSLWYLWDFWDDLLLYLNGLSFEIDHIYRETNSLADILTNTGA